MLSLGAGQFASAQELRRGGFQLQYDGSGIRSLKRTGDRYDTDYIAANGRLGRVLIRYRRTPNGDWRELQDLLLRAATDSSIQYELGRLALRTHATIVTLDPLFGDFAYGGLLSRDGQDVRVVPRDGLRSRFHVVRGDQRLHMILERDGYAKEKPIVVSDDLSRIEFTIENRAGLPHQATLSISGLPPGPYDVRIDDRSAGIFTTTGTSGHTLTLPIGPAEVGVRVMRL